MKPVDFKRIRLRHGDILVLVEPNFDMELRAEIEERLKEVLGNKDVLVLFVTKFSDIRSLNDRQLRNLGLCRC